MLVVDRDALQAVDVLHFIHEILLQFLRAQHIQDIVRIGRPIHQRFAGPDPIPLVNVHVFALGNEILLHIAHLVVHDHFPHAFDEPAIGDFAVDFTDHRLLFGSSRFEQLGHSREASRDVLRLRRLTGDFGQDVARIHHRPLFHEDVRADRQ